MCKVAFQPRLAEGGLLPMADLSQIRDIFAAPRRNSASFLWTMGELTISYLESFKNFGSIQISESIW
jgi:hypothetical protein